eukprot:42342_1
MHLSSNFSVVLLAALLVLLVSGFAKGANHNENSSSHSVVTAENTGIQQVRNALPLNKTHASNNQSKKLKKKKKSKKQKRKDLKAKRKAGRRAQKTLRKKIGPVHKSHAPPSSEDSVESVDTVVVTPLLEKKVELNVNDADSKKGGVLKGSKKVDVSKKKVAESTGADDSMHAVDHVKSKSDEVELNTADDNVIKFEVNTIKSDIGDLNADLVLNHAESENDKSDIVVDGGTPSPIASNPETPVPNPHPEKNEMTLMKRGFIAILIVLAIIVIFAAIDHFANNGENRKKLIAMFGGAALAATAVAATTSQSVDPVVSTTASGIDIGLVLAITIPITLLVFAVIVLLLEYFHVIHIDFVSSIVESIKNVEISNSVANKTSDGISDARISGDLNSPDIDLESGVQ